MYGPLCISLLHRRDPTNFTLSLLSTSVAYLNWHVSTRKRRTLPGHLAKAKVRHTIRVAFLILALIRADGSRPHVPKACQPYKVAPSAD